MSPPADLARGRQEFERRNWPAAYELLRGAQEPEDLMLLAVAAQLAGHDEAGVDHLHRAHNTFLKRGDAQSAIRAGANLAIPAPLDPMVWDDTLEELLATPRRRDARIPARFVVWPQTSETSQRGTALNLSERGMLLETQQPLTVGATIEVFFELPGGQAGAEVVGQVVRESRPPGASPQYGVDFMLLRGNSRGEIHTFVESDTEH